MKITNFDNKQTLTVEKDGAVYEVMIPDFCNSEEDVKRYIVAYIGGKQVEKIVDEPKFDLSTMVNKKIDA